MSSDLDHVLSRTRDLWDAFRDQNIFITGGTGFVGRWLIESLMHANDRLDLRVHAIVLTRDPEAFRAKAPACANHSAIELLRGNATSFAFPQRTVRFVIHASTERQFDADVEGTRRVLEFARTHGTRRLLFTSSGAAYGSQPADLARIPEDYAGAPPTTDPSTGYGQAKRVSEWLCTVQAGRYGFDAPIARMFAFVGPHLPLDLNFAIGNFIGDVLRGGPVRIAGDGTPYRSYLYAADLAIWLWTILMRGQSGRIYNVGSPNPVTIAELARIVAANTVAKTCIEIARQPAPGAAPSRYVPATDRAEIELGLQVWIGLEEAIRRTYAWNCLR